MNPQPPKWARRFLEWYCHPALLEEIQGDATELFYERLKTHSLRNAQFAYIWNVIRFFRWSNMRRKEPGMASHVRMLWSLNFKMSVRYAARHNVLFGIKTLGLVLCLAFSLLLTAFMVNELTFDHFHKNFQRIYRVASHVEFQDQVTDYAVSPLPLGPTLKEKLPEVEDYTRFMYTEKPIFRIDDQMFYDEETYSADSTFLKVFTFNFIGGGESALDEPNKVVLSETTANKFFGDEDAMGKMIKFGDRIDLMVAAVIEDTPSNSHLQFDALISWSTFGFRDEWSNINAYTYVLLSPGSQVSRLKDKLPTVLSTFYDMVRQQFNATYDPEFQPIDDIHFAGFQDEDVARKTDKSNLPILVAVVVLFLITGLVNHLNLSLAELTANLKKIGILKVFGAGTGSQFTVIITDTVFALSIVLPLVVIFGYFGLIAAAEYLSITLNQAVFTNPMFLGVAAGFMVLLILSSRLNALVLSRAGFVIHSLKGKLTRKESGTTVRKILVGIQLAFSIIMIALIFVIIDQFHYIQSADKGFDDSNTIAVKVRWGEKRRVEGFMEAVRNEPGVDRASESSYYPGVVETKYVFEVENEKGMEQQLIPLIFAGYDYLDVLNVHLIAGREFDRNRPSDMTDAFIINETAAREFGWKEALGKKINGPVGGDGTFDREGTVIGVVRDFNFASLHNRIEPLIVMLTNESWGGNYIYVKTTPVHSRDLVDRIEKQFRVQWPDLPFEWEYLDAKYLHLYEKDAELKNIFQAGLVISVLISCLGIFSISALLVSLRTKEMGIRKVVGASALQLFILHTRSFTAFLIISILVAWPAIYFLSHAWLQGFAYHIDVTAWYFILPGVITLLITVLTSGYHGAKSAMVNPVEVLQYE